MTNILAKIAANKKLEIEELKVIQPEKQLRELIPTESDHPFRLNPITDSNSK